MPVPAFSSRRPAHARRRVLCGVAAALAAWLALPGALLPGTAPAGEPQAGALTVERPWSRATAPGATVGVGYLVLRNGGREPDALVAARSAVASRVEFHVSSNDGGMMKMRQMPRVELPAGATLRLAPGGLHLMLIGLRRPLVAGEKLPLTLRFERGGEQQVELEVVAAGADAPAGGHDSHQHH